MKTRNLILGTLTFVAASFLISCEDNNVEPQNEYGILPERFKIDIPGSLSKIETKSATLKSTEEDTLSGNDIYAHLTNFIAIGEAGAELVEDIIYGITFHHIDQVKTLTFVSDDDNRVKNLVVYENAEYGDRIWEYQLTLTDAESEGNSDNGIGMQIFWNKSPIAGIAILKPYNINRDDENSGEAMFKIEYSEEGTEKYETYMSIEISGLPLPSAETEPFAVDNIKMFVGKKGDRIDVYGNSNHPNAQFNIDDTETMGYNWAFVASGFKSSDIGVAEVGLPFNSEDITTRQEILVENSIKTVITREMTNYIITENPQLTGFEELIATYLQPYLSNAEAPGFFNKDGFVQAGTAPDNSYTELETSIKELIPYNPKTVTELNIEFK
jgi:hypothetical protein